MEEIKCPVQGCNDKLFCHCMKEEMKQRKKRKAARGWTTADNFEKELGDIEFKRKQKTFYIKNMKVKPESGELSFNGNDKIYTFGNRKKLIEFIKKQI